jgi:hypothetical protein
MYREEIGRYFSSTHERITIRPTTQWRPEHVIFKSRPVSLRSKYVCYEYKSFDPIPVTIRKRLRSIRQTLLLNRVLHTCVHRVVEQRNWNDFGMTPVRRCDGIGGGGAVNLFPETNLSLPFCTLSAFERDTVTL